MLEQFIIRKYAILIWPKSIFEILMNNPGEGHLNDERGYQACPWTHKKHPKQIFPRLKFSPLNKYSSGIWYPKQVFFPFFPTLSK